MKRALGNLTAAALGVGVGLAICVGVSAIAYAGTDRPVNSASDQPPIDLAILDAGSKGPALPPNLDLEAVGETGLLPESIRFLGASGVATYYVGTELSGDLCLVTYIAGPNWTSGASCTTAERFNSGGIGGRTYAAGTGAAEAYLLPDAIANSRALAATDSRSSDLQQLSGNLFVVDPSLSEIDRAALTESIAAFGIAVLSSPLETGEEK